VLSAREAANAAHFEGLSQPDKIEPLAG